jgi:hypothetical protein
MGVWPMSPTGILPVVVSFFLFLNNTDNGNDTPVRA